MSFEAWTIFALFWVVFVTTPGPNAVNCITNGMHLGFAHSLWGVAAILTLGSCDGACVEALDRLEAQKVGLNYCRVKAFPFADSIREFIDKHDIVYVVEQNRDAQFKTLLVNDIDADQTKLVSLLHYDGMPINAGFVVKGVLEDIKKKGRAA